MIDRTCPRTSHGKRFPAFRGSVAGVIPAFRGSVAGVIPAFRGSVAGVILEWVKSERQVTQNSLQDFDNLGE